MYIKRYFELEELGKAVFGIHPVIIPYYVALAKLAKNQLVAIAKSAVI